MDNKIISLAKIREQKKQNIEKNQPPSSEIIKLWKLSLSLDELIKSGVMEDKLSPDEVATIFANRLGMLIHCCENSVELAKFCMEIIGRMNEDPTHEKGA